MFRVLVTTFLTSFGLLFFMCITNYQPYKETLYELALASKDLIKDEGSSLREIVLISEGEENLEYYVARNAYKDLVLNGDRSKSNSLVWHLNTALWYLANSIFLNDKDIFYLWIYFTDLNGLSIKFFNKKIDNISLEEKIKLVVMVRAPSYYLPNSEVTEKRVKSILQQIKHR